MLASSIRLGDSRAYLGGHRRMDDTEIEPFLTIYAQACVDAGVEPLPKDELAVIANAILTGVLPALVTLH